MEKLTIKINYKFNKFYRKIEDILLEISQNTDDACSSTYTASELLEQSQNLDLDYEDVAKIYKQVVRIMQKCEDDKTSFFDYIYYGDFDEIDYLMTVADYIYQKGNSEQIELYKQVLTNR